MAGNQSAFQRFAELLDTRQVARDPDRDIRDYVLSLRERPTGVGYVRANLNGKFAANMPLLFPRLKALDDEGVEKSEHFLLTGTIFRDPEHTHKGGVRFLNAIPPAADILFFEPAFVATSHSWAHAFKGDDPNMACLGYVYDDMAYYFMADYPNRLIERLNSALELTDEERARARGLIDRMVARRISKYNAQPMEAPSLPSGYERRVLVCDQAYADASTSYGKLDEAAFEAMLVAAINENPDAQIIVKTHPDSTWEEKKRAGYYTHLNSTGRVVVLRDPVNPYTMFDLVDTVYVGTSQMGLEALFAGKKVVTFGAPFYAGWGLTDDRQEIRHRTRPRTLEDIFHAFYVWYTIYHVPGAPVPSQIEDALDFIEAHRPFALPPTKEELSATPKVSVIIPVHGVEAFIEDCIASIQAQTLREIEIIPVNDVSPDGAQAIIDRMAAADPRIRPMVLEENVGQGFARNKALDAARGEFVWFIDADDWMGDPNTLKSLVEVAEANGSDMVRGKKAAEAVFGENGDYLYDREDETEANFLSEIDRTTYAETPGILRNRHFWVWLYRRDWLDKIGGRFVTTQWEERAFLTRALVNARVLSLTTIPATTYRVRPASTARRKRGPKDFERMLRNFGATFEALAEKGAADRSSDLREHLEYHLSQFVDHMMMTAPYAYYSNAGDEERTGFLDRIRGVLDTYDFRPGDLTTAANSWRMAHVRAGSYGLVAAALRAERHDILDMAIRLAPIPQDLLYQIQLETPANDRAADLQAALNRYARNDKVAGPRTSVAAPKTKPRIVVHIGATKTGSTYIQHLMETNRPALLREGVWYPEVGLFWQTVRPHKQAGHSEFTPAAVRNTPDLKEHIERGLALMGDRIHTIVLSSEAFFLQKNAWQIARYFADYPVEMIVYLRRQDEWANAQYSEFVAGGAVGRVDVPFAEWLADPQTRERLDYRNPLTAWEEAIGRDRITARLFDKRAFEGGDLLTDFAASTKLPVLLDLPRPDDLQANSARLSTSHVELVRSYNTRDFRNRDAYFTFIETVTTGFQAFRAAHDLPMDRPWFLTPALASRIMQDAAESNAQIARTYFGREDGILFDGACGPGPEAQTPIYPDEMALVAEAYEVARPVDAAAQAPGTGLQRSRRGAPRIVNYGHFGWRLWLLTPIVDRLYVSKALPDQVDEFRREPADFTREHWARYRPMQVGLMYPNTPALGGFRIWVPVIRAALKAAGQQQMIPALEDDPILFLRRSPSRAGRILSRLVFPRGEIR